MSALIWAANDESIYLLTDTLRTDTQGVPNAFSSKLWTVPTLNLVIACTGMFQLVQRWHQWVSLWGPRDLTELDEFASIVLPIYLRELIEKNGEPTGAHSTSTIYHFAIEDGRPVRYTYRSTNGFRSEKANAHLDEVALKPAPLDGKMIPFTDLAGMVAAACRLKCEQDRDESDSAVRIGGELWLTTLSDGQILQERVYRFPDYSGVAAALPPLS